MKNWRCTAVVCLAVYAVPGCATTHNVYPVEHPKARGVRGVNYALPRTVVVVQIPVRRRIYVPGKYAAFAKELLGTAAKTSKSSTFSVEAPSVQTQPEPDPNHAYVVKIAGGAFEQRELMMELTERGLLSKGRSEAADQTAQLIVETLKTSAGIAGKATAAGSPLGEAESDEINDQLVRWILVQLDNARVAAIEADRYARVITWLKKPGSTRLPEATLTILLADLPPADEQDAVLSYPLYGRLRAAVAALHDSTARQISTKDVASAKRGIDVREWPANNDFVPLQPPAAVSLIQAAVTKALGLTVGEPTHSKLMNVGLTSYRGERAYIAPKQAAWLYEVLNYSQARLLADAIATLRTERIELLLGKSQLTDVSGIEGALKELTTREHEMTAHFLGKTVSARWIARFEVLPAAMSCGPVDQRLALLEVSPTEGVVIPPSDAVLTSVPPKGFLNVSRSTSETPEVVHFALTANVGSEFAGRVAARTQINSRRPQGIYYRIPATAEIELFSQKSTGRRTALAKDTVAVAQYGALQALPTSTGSLAKSSYDFELYSSSGALKKITVKADALPPNTISGIGEAVTTIQDAEAARKKASEEAAAAEREQTVEIARLEGQKAILELEAAIRALEAEVPASGVNDQ